MNPENIPSAIFDWLENSNFSSLSDEQKTEVLKHFSEEEYDELHYTSFAIKSIHQPVLSQSAIQRKQNLVAKFETRYEKKKQGFVFYNTLLKVAAALILLGCGWILNYLIPDKTTASNGLATMIDTVYLSKEIIADPVKIYDTLYIEKASNQKNTSKNNSYTENRHVIPTPENNNQIYLEEIGSTMNRQKRNSMKDDSLVKEFSVIML